MGAGGVADIPAGAEDPPAGELVDVLPDEDEPVP